jgi:hypothetical protein
VIFDGDNRAPTMDTGLGFPIESHAAFMLRISPPLSTTALPSFWSLTKDGRSFLSLTGPGGTWSAEESYGSGLKWGAGSTGQGESFRFDADGAISLHARRGDNRANHGINISSDSGAVRIYGGGSTTVGRTLAASAPVGEGEGGLPAVLIESATNLHLNAAKTIKLTALELDLRNAGSLLLSGNSGVEIRSGDRVSIDPNVYELTCMGQAVETFSGPKNSLPTNMPVKKTSVVATPATGNPGGPTDVYRLVYGDKTEELTAGDHVTDILVGNRTYKVGVGTIKHQSGLNSVSIGPSGISGTATVGGVAFSAPGGAASITASSTVSITGATAVLTAGAITMPGAHLYPGGVLTETTINPLTGLPWTASGTIGVPTVRVGA